MLIYYQFNYSLNLGLNRKRICLWLLSPANFNGNDGNARAGDVNTTGELDNNNVSNTSGGVRL